MSEAEDDSSRHRTRRPGRRLYGVAAMVTPFTTAFSMMSLVVPLFAINAGASSSLVGALVATKSLAPMLIAILVGRLIDSVGGRIPALLALAGTAVAVATLAIWPTLPVLFLVQAATGAFHLVFVVASQRLVSTMGTGVSGESNFGWYATFQSAGQLLGPLLAGAVLDLIGFRNTFVTVAAIFAASYAASLLTASWVGSSADPTSTRTGSIEGGGTRQAMRSLFANPGFLMAVAVSYAVLLTQSVRQAFLPVYLEELAFTGTAIGLVMSSLGLVAMMVRPAMPAIIRGLGGRSRSLLVMVTVMAVGVALTSAFTDLAGLLLATALVGIGHGVTQPLSMVMVGDHVHRQRLGLALGVRLTANRIAQVLGPLVIGLLADVIGVRLVFVIAAGLLVLALPLLLRWRPAFDRAEADLARSG